MRRFQNSQISGKVFCRRLRQGVSQHLVSRIGRKPIEVPAGVTVTVDPGRVTVHGPKGELRQQVPLRMSIEQNEGTINVTRPSDRGDDRALHGLTRTLVANMVEGVTNGFEKRLEIQGVGYRAAMSGHEPGAPGRLLPPGQHHAADGHRVRGPGADPGDRARDRQAGRRPDRRRDPQGAPARAVQGQGHPLRGRARETEGRQGRKAQHDRRSPPARSHGGNHVSPMLPLLLGAESPADFGLPPGGRLRPRSVGPISTWELSKA